MGSTAPAPPPDMLTPPACLRTAPQLSHRPEHLERPSPQGRPRPRAGRSERSGAGQWVPRLQVTKCSQANGGGWRGMPTAAADNEQTPRQARPSCPVQCWPLTRRQEQVLKRCLLGQGVPLYEQACGCVSPQGSGTTPEASQLTRTTALPTGWPYDRESPEQVLNPWRSCRCQR